MNTAGSQFSKNNSGNSISNTGTPFKALQYDANGDIQEVNIFVDDTGIPFIVMVNGSRKLIDDASFNALQISARQLIANDGITVHINWENVLGMILSTVIANGSIANDAAAGVFGLTSGMPYYTNVAGEGILKIKL